MVRFARGFERSQDMSNGWHLVPKKHLGILVEYDKLMQIAHVLHKGEVIKLRPVFVEKAGKKDFNVEEE